MSKFLRMGYEVNLESTMDDFLNEARRHPGFELHLAAEQAVSDYARTPSTNTTLLRSTFDDLR
jgi:hypothetical protein